MQLTLNQSHPSSEVGGFSQNFFFRIQYLVTALFYFPFLQLYLNGPSIGGYGFWAGREPEDICSEITHIPSDHWQMHQDVCLKYIFLRFESFLMIITLVFYLASVYCFVRCALSIMRLLLLWYFRKECVCQQYILIEKNE